MRKTLVAAALAGATFGLASLAVAQVGPPPETPPVPAPPSDPPADTPVGPPESVPPVEIPETTTTTALTEPVEVEVVEEGVDAEAAVHPDNHGLAVSTAAHECPEGPEHGPCVSAVARDHDDDGTPDHGPGSEGFAGG
jgi:hypothetical protein